MVPLAMFWTLLHHCRFLSSFYSYYCPLPLINLVKIFYFCYSSSLMATLQSSTVLGPNSILRQWYPFLQVHTVPTTSKMVIQKRGLKLSLQDNYIFKMAMQFSAVKQAAVGRRLAERRTKYVKKEVCDSVSMQFNAKITKFKAIPLAICAVLRSVVLPSTSPAPAPSKLSLITQQMNTPSRTENTDQTAYLVQENRFLRLVSAQMRGRWGRSAGSRSSLTSWSNSAELTSMLMPTKQLQRRQKSWVKMRLPEKAQSIRQRKIITVIVMFLRPKKTKKQDRRQQNQRPWCRISRSRNRNCPILKSLTAAAELPSFPMIPTPTLASSIIPTSFPPSPMASVTSPSRSFTNRTITAFSFGELRQKMTDLALASKRENTDVGRSRAQAICRPQTINVNGTPLAVSISTCSQNFYGSTRSAERRKTRQSSLISCERYPMFSAVSNLSPVIIITRIPAFCSRESVIGTSSCSRSSIPVAPMISRLLSRPSTSACSCSSASSFEIMRSRTANRIRSFQARYCLISLAERAFLAKTSVLSPSLAKKFMLVLKASELEYQWAFSKMAESAPLVQRVTLFLFAGSRTTTLIRLRLLKPTTSSNSKRRRCPKTSKLTHPRARPRKLKPMAWAQLTKQTSSGLDPWYSSLRVSRTTSWQSAMASTNSQN